MREIYCEEIYKILSDTWVLHSRYSQVGDYGGEIYHTGEYADYANTSLQAVYPDSAYSRTFYAPSTDNPLKFG